MMIILNRNEDTAFSKFIQLLMQLHRLIAEGKGDEDEAEVVRDQMEDPWRQLSPDEIELVDGLSADLYTIGEDREEPMGEPDQTILAKSLDATKREEWETALKLLRENESSLPPDDVAFIRGACWAYLNQPDVAILFLQEAGQIKPLQPDQEILLLTCMIAANKAEDALPRAEDILKTESNPKLLLKAAEVFSILASEADRKDASPLREKAIDSAKHGLKIAEKNSPDKVLSIQQVSAYLHLSLNYEQLGQTKLANEACRNALSLDPNHADALALLGWLNYDQYPQAEKEHCREYFHRGLACSIDFASQLSAAATSVN